MRQLQENINHREELAMHEADWTGSCNMENGSLLQTEVKCNYSDVHGVGECIVLEEFIAMTVVWKFGGMLYGQFL